MTEFSRSVRFPVSKELLAQQVPVFKKHLMDSVSHLIVAGLHGGAPVEVALDGEFVSSYNPRPVTHEASEESSDLTDPRSVWNMLSVHKSEFAIDVPRAETSRLRIVGRLGNSELIQVYSPYFIKAPDSSLPPSEKLPDPLEPPKVDPVKQFGDELRAAIPPTGELLRHHPNFADQNLHYSFSVQDSNYLEIREQGIVEVNVADGYFRQTHIDHDYTLPRMPLNDKASYFPLLDESTTIDDIDGEPLTFYTHPQHPHAMEQYEDIYRRFGGPSVAAMYMADVELTLASVRHYII